MVFCMSATAPEHTGFRRSVLARARLEHLPVDGPGSPTVRQQGRQLTEHDPEQIADLISSIGAVGVINPILCERHPDQTVWLVAGERRLQASRHLARTQTTNPTLSDGIPALVVPGPLTELDRRDWQLIENVARADLTPGELARALLLDRCALLTHRLHEAHIDVPDQIGTISDPAARFRELDQYRVETGAHQIGAPWEDVIERLGLELSKSRAQQFVRAFAAIPEEISSEMDAERVSLNGRLGWTKLARTRQEVADRIWGELKRTDRTELLSAAVDAAMSDPTLDAPEAIEAAAATRAAADHARADAGRKRHQNQDETWDHDEDEPNGNATPTGQRPPPTDENQPELSELFDAAALIRELERATVALRAGHHLDPRQKATLQGLLPTMSGYVNESA